MSKKYEAKQPTGREYVDYTKEFCGYTISRCMKLPDEWNGYLLQPLVNDAEEIEQLVILANRVFVNEKVLIPELCIEAYQERDDHLQKALRYFDDYDIKFERLMSYLDVEEHEKRRLKFDMIGILNEIRREEPELANVKIQMVSHKDAMEYRAANGSVYEKLQLNSKNLDRWLDLRKASEEEIEKRVSSDRNAVRRLTKKVS